MAVEVVALFVVVAVVHAATVVVPVVIAVGKNVQALKHSRQF